ncbi:hypothetical protein AB4212_18045 [Streptomyces sp. 2MCAF27]
MFELIPHTGVAVQFLSLTDEGDPADLVERLRSTPAKRVRKDIEEWAGQSSGTKVPAYSAPRQPEFWSTPGRFVPDTQMMTTSMPRYGEQITSFETILSELTDDGNSLGRTADRDAMRYNHLRGLIMGQGTVIEGVLVNILHKIDPAALEGLGDKPTVGRVLGAIRKSNLPVGGGRTGWPFDLIAAAIERRNRSVHDSLGIVYVVAPPIDTSPPTAIAYLGLEQITEADLLNDLAALQEATRAATQIWIDLHT